MKDIELVIRIPEELAKQQIFSDVDLIKTIAPAVHNGILLPEGHGELVDADKTIDLLNKEIDKHDKMMAKYESYSNNQIPLWWWKGICRKTVIVEADRESET